MISVYMRFQYVLATQIVRLKMLEDTVCTMRCDFRGRLIELKHRIDDCAGFWFWICNDVGECRRRLIKKCGYGRLVLITCHRREAKALVKASRWYTLTRQSINAHNVYYVKLNRFMRRPMFFPLRICGYGVNYANLWVHGDYNGHVVLCLQSCSWQQLIRFER